jgi:2-oxoglutarate dehydrogenase E2 component (dihydrolipoamide succinyltransferase)
MREEIKVPQLGESITEATIGTILKPTGSSVAENDEIIELETEKVNQVLYAPFAGVVSWRVKEGESLKIGDVIGTIDSEAKAEVQEKAPSKPTPAPPKPSPAEKEAAKGEGGRMMAKQFVQALTEAKPPLEEPKPAPPPEKAGVEEGRETRRRMTKMRQTIANRLVDALHTAAMLTTFNEVDMSAILQLREKYKESFAKRHGVKLGFMSFFVKAVVEGLKKFPDLNAYLDKEEIVSRRYYDIGIAVATDRGLVVPVIRECDHLTFPDIEKAIAHFAQKAREGKLAIEDLREGGFTITNGGVYGSLLSTPILNPPQVGILGMHKIMKRPVVVEDAIVIRPMMYLALSYDHRIVDGKEAVSFLVCVKEVLEDPSRLMFLETDEEI